MTTAILKWDSDNLTEVDVTALSKVVDQLGVESGIAQELEDPISSTKKLLATPNQVMLLYIDAGSQLPVGFVKYGRKDLYLYKKTAKGKVEYTQMERTMCVLDFYVSSSQQRQGIGIVLFQGMIKDLSTSPEKLAYDRPSNNLLPFLAKHYGLTNPDHQPNRFTLFDGFFS